MDAQGAVLEKGHRRPMLVTVNIVASAVEMIVMVGQVLPTSMREY
jgi:hypothetical protein